MMAIILWAVLAGLVITVSALLVTISALQDEIDRLRGIIKEK